MGLHESVSTCVSGVRLLGVCVRVRAIAMSTHQSGLCKSIRNLPWLCSQDPGQFFPRCYDLADKEDQYV